MTDYKEPHHQTEHKKALLNEMKACIEDMKTYQAEMKISLKEGDKTRYRENEERLEKASQQHSVAKEEYVDLFGTGGL